MNDMSLDNRGQQLHDRATRGQPLSEDEQAALERWYAAQDEIEPQLLVRPPLLPDELQSWVSEIARQLAELTASIRRLDQENSQLRLEIAQLYAMLTQSSQMQSA